MQIGYHAASSIKSNVMGEMEKKNLSDRQYDYNMMPIEPPIIIQWSLYTDPAPCSPPIGREAVPVTDRGPPECNQLVIYTEKHRV